MGRRGRARGTDGRGRGGGEKQGPGSEPGTGRRRSTVRKVWAEMVELEPRLVQTREVTPRSWRW